MQNKRHLARIQLPKPLEIYVPEEKEPFGLLIDVHFEGFLVMHRRRLIKQKQLFAFCLEIPHDWGDFAKLSFQGEALWTTEDFSPELYNTGFRFVNFSKENTKAIQRLSEIVAIPNEPSDCASGIA